MDQKSMNLRKGTAIETRAQSTNGMNNTQRVNQVAQHKYESYKVNKPGFIANSSSQVSCKMH